MGQLIINPRGEQSQDELSTRTTQLHPKHGASPHAELPQVLQLGVFYGGTTQASGAIYVWIWTTLAHFTGNI